MAAAFEPLIVTAAEGVMLTAPVDMVRLWPDLWPNEKAADRTLAAGRAGAARIRAGSLSARGAEDETALGHFDRALIPDPRAWLTEHLGSLASEGL